MEIVPDSLCHWTVRTDKKEAIRLSDVGASKLGKLRPVVRVALDTGDSVRLESDSHWELQVVNKWQGTVEFDLRAPVISAPVHNVLCWDRECLDAALSSLSLELPDIEIALPLLATSTADLFRDGPLNALGTRSIRRLDSLVRLCAWTILVEIISGK